MCHVSRFSFFILAITVSDRKLSCAGPSTFLNFAVIGHVVYEISIIWHRFVGYSTVYVIFLVKFVH